VEFRVAASDFIRFCSAERQLSEHTVQAYTLDLADFGKWLPVGAMIDEINETTLKNYLASMIAERRLSAATVRRRFACLRAFFRRLIETHGKSDPFAKLRLRLPRRRRLPRTLSQTEVSSLILSPKQQRQTSPIKQDPYLRTAIRLMVSTGIRVGELCKLRTDDLSPDGSALRIHGKGSRDRIAYITDQNLKRELCLLANSRQQPASSCDALFINRHGSKMRPQSIRTKLRKYACELGLSRRITPHMLRHTAATLLIETGVDIRFVQRLLGHSSIATTEIYTHVSDQALKTTLERAGILNMLARY
jgi:integrase/recombinase XerD